MADGGAVSSSNDFLLDLLKAAAAHMPDVLGVQAPRKEVPGLVVPRRPAPRILPQNMGRGKGTVPTNPFSGNWQSLRPAGAKVAATAAAVPPGLPERVGRAVGGFIGRRPVAALALGYGAYRAPDIVRAVKARTTEHEPPVGYGTVHAVRGLAQLQD